MMIENTVGPKIHDADLTAKATLEANLAGLIASGYSDTEIALADPALSAPVSVVEDAPATVVPVKAKKAKKAKRAAKK